MAVCCGFTEIELLHLPCGLMDSLRQSCGILWHPVALCQEAACPCCPKIYKRPKRSRCRCWKLSSAQKLASCRCKRWKGNLGGIAILKQFEDIPRHVNCPSSSSSFSSFHSQFCQLCPSERLEDIISLSQVQRVTASALSEAIASAREVHPWPHAVPTPLKRL